MDMLLWPSRHSPGRARRVTGKKTHATSMAPWPYWARSIHLLAPDSGSRSAVTVQHAGDMLWASEIQSVRWVGQEGSLTNIQDVQKGARRVRIGYCVSRMRMRPSTLQQTNICYSFPNRHSLSLDYLSFDAVPGKVSRSLSTDHPRSPWIRYSGGAHLSD